MTRWRFVSLALFVYLCLAADALPIFAQTPSPLATIAPLPNVTGSVAGTIAGSFGVTDEGAATYAIPISLPPGVNGLVPKLAINYDSRMSDGPLGVGFSLSGIPVISLCPAVAARDGFTDPVDLDGNDRFCLDGQPLMASSGVYGAHGTTYKTEIESFVSIVSNEIDGATPKSFTVYQKDGLKFEFGISDASRRKAVGSTFTLSWHLEKVSDKAGNYYTIRYLKNVETSEILPDTIEYTANANAATIPSNSVKFVWGATNDPAVVRYVGSTPYSNSGLLKAVKVYVGASLVRYYQLSYKVLDIPVRPHLSEIQECGTSESDCLPATTFSWGPIPESVNYASQPALNYFGGNSFPNAQTNPVFTGDWNGDGRSDMGRWISNSIVLYVNLPTGWAHYTDLIIYPGNDASNFTKFPIITGDWNGDGRTDFGRGMPDAFVFYVASSTSATYTQIGSIQEFNSTKNPDVKESPVFVGDFDGDGRSDVGRALIDRTGKRTRIYRSTGTAFEVRDNINGDVFPEVSGGVVKGALVVGDWNGDGMSDLARITSTVQYWSISSPNGLWNPFQTNFNLQQYGVDDHVDNSPIILGDWNADGCTDWAQVGNAGVLMFEARCVDVVMWQPTGASFSGPFITPIFGKESGFSTYTQYPIFSGDFNRDGYADFGRVEGNSVALYVMRGRNAYFYSRINDLSPAQSYSDAQKFPLIMGDWNGDGFSDFARIGGNSVSFYAREYYETQALRSIKDGFGAETSIQYGLLTNPNVYEAAEQQRATVRVVTSIMKSNGIGSLNTTRYKYHALTGDTSGRRQGGFERVVETDEATGVTTTTWFKTEQPFSGRAFKVEKRTASGKTISLVTDTLQSKTLSYGGIFIWKSKSVQEVWDLSGELVDRVSKSVVYDDYGSVTQIEISHLDGNIEKTTNQYFNDPASNVLGRLISAQVTKTTPGQPAITRTAQFEYDTARGLLIREIIEPNNTLLKVTKRYEYDTFGNLVVSALSGDTLPERKESRAFDARGLFPVRIVNARGHIEYREYDLRHGTVIKSTGANGEISKASFDAFGRVTLETFPNGSVRRTVYFKSSGGTLANAVYYVRVDSSGESPVITFYDNLGREVRRESTGFAGERIFTDKVHDERGNVTHLSTPYKSGTLPEWAVSEFDVLGRQTYLVLPGNRITRTEYQGLTVVITDPKNNKSTRKVNNIGLLMSASDPAGTVNYLYDSFGNLIQLTDPAGNKTVTTYDTRGNRLTIADPDTGKTKFTYNVLGELTKEERADGSTIVNQYDALGRIITRRTSSGLEQWIYDSASYGKGKISTIKGLNGYQESFQYDNLGRTSQVTKFIAGRTYSTSLTYDQYGRITSYRYPSNYSVSYQYNRFGYLAAVLDSSSSAKLWTANSLDSAGRITKETYGNGLITTSSYDIGTGVLTRVRAGTFFDMSFTYDEVGNLKSRADNFQRLSEKFSYDSSYRLTSSQVGLNAPITITYDALGNIITKSDVGRYFYAASAPHAVASITGVLPNTYYYNRLGQRSSSSYETYTYAWFGAAATIKNIATETRFSYSPSMKRTEQTIYAPNTSGSYDNLLERKTYVNENYEEVVTQGITKQIHYLRAGNSTFAIYTVPSNGAATHSYLHKDHQGSIQALSNQNGALVERLSFDAWGRKRNENWTSSTKQVSSLTDRAYTGHEYLEENCLIHMNGRVYDPVIGRFLSPDPFIQAPENTQSLNRYSYVLNNPLSHVDPSGFFFKKLIKAVLSIAVSFAVSTILGPEAGVKTLTALFESFGVISGLAQSASVFVIGMASGVVVTTVNGVFSGGGVSESFKRGIQGSLWSGISKVATFNIGELFEKGGLLSSAFSSEYLKEAKAVAHGISQGGIASARGDSFLSGFVAAAGASFTEGDSGAVGFVKSALVGGTASALAGGKFDDGVLTSSTIYMFNKCMHSSCGIVNSLSYDVAVPEAVFRVFGNGIEEVSSRKLSLGVALSYPTPSRAGWQGRFDLGVFASGGVTKDYGLAFERITLASQSGQVRDLAGRDVIFDSQVGTYGGGAIFSEQADGSLEFKGLQMSIGMGAGAGGTYSLTAACSLRNFQCYGAGN